MRIRPTRKRCRIGLRALVLVSAVVGATACELHLESTRLPTRLSDDEFWSLMTRLSEPAGVFRHSDNLVSNEDLFVHTVRLMSPRDGVYIGVGPEQNFTYIARLRPAMAFIVDIRQENRNLHLMYKALFELSNDRAEFVSRLFSRERPSTLDAESSVHAIFTAYEGIRRSASLYATTARLVRERLVDLHRLPLSADDLRSIDDTLNAFATDGPQIHYGRSREGSEAGPSYRTLMTATDFRGVRRSYLSSADAFAIVKDLHSKNLIVPVVGDFGGPHALRAVGDYVRQQGSVVAAFYSSNVEVYLSNQQIAAFCASLAALPYDSRTWLIRSKDLQRLSAKVVACGPVTHSR
jgi:hypothetical protein